MPRSAASSSVPGLVTVTHIGGCGFWSGFGSTARSGIEKQRPRCANVSCIHIFGSTRTYSSQSFLVSSGSASKPPISVHVEERAVPNSSRPPESRSRNAARSATRIGWLISGTHTTAPCPTRIRWVCIATAVRNSSGADECEYSSRKWCSTTHAHSKPSASATRACSSAFTITSRSRSGLNGRGTESSKKIPNFIAREERAVRGRQGAADLEPVPPRTALDREARADAARAIGHDAQASPGFELRGIESVLAVVRDDELERPVRAAQVDVHASRRPVLHGVGDRLLRDAEQVRGHRTADGGNISQAAERASDPKLPLAVARQRLERRRQLCAELGQRIEAARERHALRDRALHERAELPGIAGLGQLARRELPRQRSRHDRDAGELLAEVVVEVSGDPLALVLAALEHLLFEPLARGGIARAHDGVLDRPPEQQRAQLTLRQIVLRASRDAVQTDLLVVGFGEHDDRNVGRGFEDPRAPCRSPANREASGRAARGRSSPCPVSARHAAAAVETDMSRSWSPRTPRSITSTR